MLKAIGFLAIMERKNTHRFLVSFFFQ